MRMYWKKSLRSCLRRICPAGTESSGKNSTPLKLRKEKLREKEAETAGQDGDEQAEKEAEANGSEDNQENQVQAQAEFSQTDSSTGIRAEAAAGVFPAGTLMIVTPLTGGENYNLLQTLLSAAADQFQVYDISFFSVSLPDFSDMQPVHPGGNVKVRMPVPEEYDLSRLAVYHISTDGGMTPVSFVVQDGMAVFETDQFSLYALVEMKEMRTDLPPSLEMTDKISRLELDRAGESQHCSFICSIRIYKSENGG